MYLKHRNVECTALEIVTLSPAFGAKVKAIFAFSACWRQDDPHHWFTIVPFLGGSRHHCKVPPSILQRQQRDLDCDAPLDDRSNSSMLASRSIHLRLLSSVQRQESRFQSKMVMDLSCLTTTPRSLTPHCPPPPHPWPPHANSDSPSWTTRCWTGRHTTNGLTTTLTGTKVLTYPARRRTTPSTTEAVNRNACSSHGC